MENKMYEELVMRRLERLERMIEESIKEDRKLKIERRKRTFERRRRNKER